MATGSYLTPNYSRSQSEIQGDLHKLACAYLKGHLTGRALYWFEVLGYRVVEDKATDYFQENWRETRCNNGYSDNSRPQREFNRFEGQGVADNRRINGRRRGGQSDHRFHNQSDRQGGSRNGSFRGQNDQKQIFQLLSDECESGDDRSRCTENPPNTKYRTITISSLRMTPVDLPYVPILLNETFITALWDTGAEKSFISKEVYRRYFSYRPRQKTTDRVVTAQGARVIT
ncbi:uncharacterized protein TNCV_4066331 [Trichonephila clavipes]|uniref:Uncharacterized protein n=1 Tax=Trichonephila clavipes TaxID=2585209 RepID=A0A8X6W8L8_TRICX|nr:uncharacterized protein TNCV_4066331 [Trichonephila clavipes]